MTDKHFSTERETIRLEMFIDAILAIILIDQYSACLCQYLYFPTLFIVVILMHLFKQFFR
jgi:hypothetical protein